MVPQPPGETFQPDPRASRAGEPEVPFIAEKAGSETVNSVEKGDSGRLPRFLTGGILSRLPRLPLLALPGAVLLLTAGVAALFFHDGTPGFLQSEEPCLLTVPAADGVYVLDRNFRFFPFREAPCEPGPLLRTGEGDHRQAMEVPEFKDFLKQWRAAVEQYPDLPSRLSEIRLSRTKDTIFFSRSGRLKIEVAHRENRHWPNTLHAVLVTAEAKGWTEGFIDLKDEDGLFIRSHSRNNP